MSLRMMCAIGVFAAAAAAQNPVTVTGELDLDGRGGAERLVVELRSMDMRPIPGHRNPVNRDGTFEFRSVAAGTYELLVTTDLGATVRTEVVQINEHTSRLTIRLYRGGAVRHNGQVSVRRLRHKPPKEAKKEFGRAEKAIRAGDNGRAVELLHKAVEIDPEYIEAHNNLGVRYLVAGRFGEARVHLDRALALDENSSHAHGNLSALALAEGDGRAAEYHARRAAALGGEAAKSEYLLGLALARQGKMGEAIPRLEEAALLFPKARLTLADILSRQGDDAGARVQLKMYLDAGIAERRPEIERWMNSLRPPQGQK